MNEESKFDRMKMTGELKGNKQAITEMLDVIQECVGRTEGKIFWLSFEVHEMKEE